MKPALGLAAWLIVTFAFAAAGALGSAGAGDFYGRLVRPAWAPPGWLFSPVWTTLYALAALAAWLVWRKERLRSSALVLFLVQLATNALWTWIFFSWRQGLWAFVEAIVLWLLVVATIVAFARTSRWAAVLLAPYLAWVTFACALTYATWQLNPGLLG